MEDFLCLYAYWNLDFIKVGLGSADISGCMMRNVTYMPSIDVRLAVHGCAFYHSQFFILPSFNAQ